MLFLHRKCIFDIKITILVEICTFLCQGPVKVPRTDRPCFWIRKTNGLRQPQMLEFRDFPVPATLFFRFFGKLNFAMEEIHSVSIFRSRAAPTRKTLYYQCFSIYFEGCLASPGGFTLKSDFSEKWNSNIPFSSSRNFEFCNIFPVFAEIRHSHKHL